MSAKEEIFAEVAPERIDMLTKLIEAYDNLGVVSTIDQSRGRVVIRVTTDTCGEVEAILANLPFPVTIMVNE